MGELLSTKNISKIYGEQAAVDKINISIQKGEIYGLIGRNGAGKTTLMKILGGLSKPTSGEFTLFGVDSGQLAASGQFSKVGTLIEIPGLIDYLSAYDNLSLKCICCGIKQRKDYIDSLLEQVGLQNTGKKTIKQFSLGMRQRLGVALALVGEPEFLILDEPINGLDPQGIAEMRGIIQKLNQERGITVLISSHILEELSKLATTYGIIDSGRLIYEDKKENYEKECIQKGLTMEEVYFQLTGGSNNG